MIFGECLIELSWDQAGTVRQGFAGDVYSVSVYLQRANPQVGVRLLCAIGTDPLSQALVDSLEAEGVDTSLLLRHPDRHAGLYAIHNTADGERSFTYWRTESAARETLELLAENPGKLLERAPDCFYLTGISLAILEPASLNRIWPLLQALREQGTRIVFDPNYRPRLWPDRDTARAAFDRAFQLSDLALPGVEDMQLLYDLTDKEQIAAMMQALGPGEIVLKDGSSDVYYGAPGDLSRYAVTPVERVVDTTAAGDSFSGTLLGCLSRGQDLGDAVRGAAAMSARVIQYPGAVIPRD